MASHPSALKGGQKTQRTEGEIDNSDTASNPAQRSYQLRILTEWMPEGWLSSLAALAELESSSRDITGQDQYLPRRPELFPAQHIADTIAPRSTTEPGTAQLKYPQATTSNHRPSFAPSIGLTDYNRSDSQWIISRINDVTQRPTQSTHPALPEPMIPLPARTSGQSTQRTPLDERAPLDKLPGMCSSRPHMVNGTIFFSRHTGRYLEALLDSRSIAQCVASVFFEDPIPDLAGPELLMFQTHWLKKSREIIRDDVTLLEAILATSLMTGSFLPILWPSGLVPNEVVCRDLRWRRERHQPLASTSPFIRSLRCNKELSLSDLAREGYMLLANFAQLIQHVADEEARVALRTIYLHSYLLLLSCLYKQFQMLEEGMLLNVENRFGRDVNNALPLSHRATYGIEAENESLKQQVKTLVEEVQSLHEEKRALLEHNDTLIKALADKPQTEIRLPSISQLDCFISSMPNTERVPDTSSAPNLQALCAPSPFGSFQARVFDGHPDSEPSMPSRGSDQELCAHADLEDEACEGRHHPTDVADGERERKKRSWGCEP